MAEIESIGGQDLEKVVGGSFTPGGWVTVGKLETGYLALRTMPTYNYGNEIRGSESYNGQPLQVTGGYTIGSDGKTYVWVTNPRTGESGWTNAAFLCW